MTLPILLLHVNIQFCFLYFAFFHCFIPIEINKLTSRIRCDYVVDVSHQQQQQQQQQQEENKNSKIDTFYGWLSYFKSNQWYQVNMRGNMR